MWFKLLTLAHVCSAFLLKCPEPAQWALRAYGHCADPSKYFCLQNDLINGYSENCTRSDFQQPGRKAVLRGGIDAEICSVERYQPFPLRFYTNVSTHCIFMKSICNAEGQVVYDNGNRNTDRTCTCDYTKGYRFLVKPKNQCFCKPSQEDCSCYLKSCSNNSHILSSDFQCIFNKGRSPVTQCQIIMHEIDNSSTISYHRGNTLIEDIIPIKVSRKKYAAVLILSFFGCAIVVILVLRIRRLSRFQFKACCNTCITIPEEKGKHAIKMSDISRSADLDLTDLPPSMKIRQCIKMLYIQLVNQIDPLPIAQILEKKKLITLVDMEEITKAVQRTKRNHILLRKIWNGNEQIYHEFTQALRNDSSLADIAKKMELQGCKINTVVDDIDDLEEKENDKIPPNIKDIQKKQIEEWVKNDKKFVETNMSTQIANELSISNILFVVGSTGHGKTSIIRHAALKLSSKCGYDIIPDVDNPNIITDFYQPERKQIFVVDNIGGRDHVNLESVEAWTNHLETIKHLVDEGSNCSGNKLRHQTKYFPKVLISCEKEIFENTVFKDIKFLKDSIRFLSKWEFSSEERMNMIIRKYSEIGEVSSTNNCTDLPFPLLCRLTVGMSKSQCKTFFKSPLKHIRNEFESMHQTDKHNFFLITLCVVLNDGFGEDDLSKCFHGNVEKKISDLCEEFNFDTKNVNTYSSIVEKLNVLKQTYIHFENDRYRLIHNKIYDIAATICGYRYFDFFISYGSCEFVAKRYKLRSVACTDGEDLIPIEKENTYFNRLIKDLENGNTYSTFQNKQLDNSEYRGKLIKYFNEWEIKIKEIVSKLNASTENIDDMRDRVTFKNNNPGYIHNRSPLMQSACKGYKDIVSMLLHMGSKINETDFHKRTPLYIAASCGRQEVIDVLLKNQADINLCDDNGKSPLHAASREGHEKIIELLITTSNVDKCDNNGRSPLFVGSEAGHKLVVELLLGKKAQLSIVDNTGASPLFVATQRGKKEVVKYLVSEGAEVNHCDNEGRSPLFIACEEGYKELVVILLDHQANPSSCDLYGRSPLHMAAKNGNTKVVQLLLSENSDKVNSTDDNGWTPVFVACEMGHTHVVQTLLEHKSDVKFCDPLGLSPLHVACSKGHKDIIKLLLPRSNINKVDESNRTSLYAACKAGHTDIAKLLLDNKADINIKNKWGASVLFVACQEGHHNVVDFLLKRKFDINKCDTHVMPLHIACAEGFLKIVDILIKNGAKINKSNNDQKTPLDIAYENGHGDIVKVLLSKNAKCTQGRNMCN